MTNAEHADKWNEIITRLTDITDSSASIKTWLLASHYLVFATEMWMVCWDKALRENITPSDDGGLATLRNAVKRHGKLKGR